MKKVIIVIIALVLLAFLFRNVLLEVVDVSTIDKPVIYIYPEEDLKVDVTLEFNGELGTTYPEYKRGWTVIANKDGKLTDPKTNSQYEYLFWEGKTDFIWNINQGFVVKGEDTASFLEEKLEYLGLNNRERNDFIVYWLPLMEANKYNLITFQNVQYENLAKLYVSPEPAIMIRVFMTFKALDQTVEIDEQELIKVKREGYTVVEWGGSEIK